MSSRRKFFRLAQVKEQLTVEMNLQTSAGAWRRVEGLDNDIVHSKNPSIISTFESQ